MKTAEIQDVHISPQWINQSEKDIDSICRACEAHKVSAITSAGDFNHRGIMANSSHKWGKYLSIAERLSGIAPVYYIYGTPTHDNPESYSSFDRIGWNRVGIGSFFTIENLLVTGMPEISSDVITAKFPDKSKSEIIESQYGLIESIFNEFYSPIIKSHNGPSLYMGHGHVSGMKFKDTEKPRSSDFMYSEEMLKKIGATRYQFGHLHLQQSFKTIWGGYGGSAHMTWGETGFQPGFNIIDWETQTETRIPYDKYPRQVMIIKDFIEISEIHRIIENNGSPRDYWVKVVCSSDAAKEIDFNGSLEELRGKFGELVGPESKITPEIEREESVRVDSEKYDECKSLEDIFKLYLPDSQRSILEKVREAEVACHQDVKDFVQKRISIVSMSVRGGIPSIENGFESFDIDFSIIPEGATIFKGKNGMGKSFYFGLAHPWPIHIPSGLSLPKLFKLKESSITRVFRVDNDTITQRILIDPTLKNPTAKYYMDINGKPVEGCKGTLSQFSAAVDEIFGSMDSFMVYVFKGQKDFKNSPSLERATESELRDIFTHLSGVDRGPIKDYAHDKVVYLGKQNELSVREIETLRSTLEDMDVIKKMEDDAKTSLATLLKKRSEKESIISSMRSEVEEIQAIESKNKEIDSRIESLKSEISKIIDEKRTIQSRIDQFENIDISGSRDQVKQWMATMSEHSKISAEINRLNSAYNNSISAWMESEGKKVSTLEEIKNRGMSLASEIKSMESEIDSLRRRGTDIRDVKKSISIPCEHCGKLSSDITSKISDFDKELLNIDSRIDQIKESVQNKYATKDSLLQEYYSIEKTSTPKPGEPPELQFLILPNIEGLDRKIIETEKLIESADELRTLSGKLDFIESERSRKAQEIESAQTEKSVIDMTIKAELVSLISETSSEISEIISKIGSEENQIKALSERMAKIKETEFRIQKISEESGKDLLDLREWETIESAFNPKGIPAMELSLLAPIVDKRANEWLKENCPRYQIQTITQDLDSRGDLAEKFKILVHDSMNDEPKNLPVISGGQSVWAIRAMRESLAQEANRRSGIVWEYCIEDEQDAALDHDIMPEYYDMISKSLSGRKMFAISHSPEAWSSADNVMDIMDFYGDGNE